MTFAMSAVIMSAVIMSAVMLSGLRGSSCRTAATGRGNLVGGLDRRHSNGSYDVVPTFVSKGGQTTHVEVECNISGF